MRRASRGQAAIVPDPRPRRTIRHETEGVMNIEDRYALDWARA